MDESMYDAVVKDDRPRLRQLLRNGGDVNMWLEDVARISGKSILHLCCEKGRYRCVQVLLEYGAQVDLQGSWGQSPLMLCIMTEYFEIAELLLNNNRDIVDQQDSYGNTPLHIAIGNDSLEAVKLLLRFNADVNSMNSNGITPMMKICSIKEAENMAEIVQLLMEAGANFDVRDFRSRRTALQLAVISKNIETTQLLLNAGADPNTIDSGGRTPLTNIIWEHLRKYPTTRRIDDDVMTIIYILVHSGANLNLSSYEHSNPLIMSIYFKCSPLVRFFLVSGASQIGPFFGGMTPILQAASKMDLASTKELLKYSCDIYSRARIVKRSCDLYLDAFELAVDRGCPEIAMLLASVGYNVTKIPYLTDWSLDPPPALQERPDILAALRSMCLEPPQLFGLSLLTIRKALFHRIEAKAEYLPLPKLLIEAVKLRDVLYD